MKIRQIAISLLLLSTADATAQTFTFFVVENKTEEEHRVVIDIKEKMVEGFRQESNYRLYSNHFFDIDKNSQGVVSVSFERNEEPLFAPANDGKTRIFLLTPSRMMVSQDESINSTYQYLPRLESDYRQTYNQLVETLNRINNAPITKITSRLIKATKYYDGLADFQEGLAIVTKNNVYGYINTSGEEVIKCQFSDAEPFENGRAKVKLNGKWGYIDKKGNQVVRCEYDRIRPFDRSRLMIEKNGKTGLMSNSLNVLAPCQYTAIGHKFEDGLLEVKKDHLVGFINEAGMEIIPCRYTAIDAPTDGMRLVCRNGLYGYISTGGKEIVECRYRYLGKLSDGCIVAQDQSGKYGYIDKSGSVVIPFMYEAAKEMNEGLAPVKMEGKYGFVNRANETVVKFKYENAGSFGNGLAPVKTKKGWEYINPKGKIVLKEPLESGYPFHDGLARAEKNNYWGYINTEGEFVIPNVYETAGDFEDGIAKVSNGRRWGLWDSKGNKIVECLYDHIGDFKNGQADVVREGLKGVIDRKGKEVIKCEYTKIESYDEKYNQIEKEEKIGLMDKSGNVIVPCAYDEIVSDKDNIMILKNKNIFYFFRKDKGQVNNKAFEGVTDFSEGLSCVWQKNQDGGSIYGYVNTDVKEVIPYIYSKAYPFSEEVAAVRRMDKGTPNTMPKAIAMKTSDGKIIYISDGNYVYGIGSQKGGSGFINKDNEEIMEFVYEDTRPFFDGLALVKYNGKWGYVNKKGYDTFKSEFNMNAPQILPKENGTIVLDDCPKTYPNISVKVSDEGDEAWIYYDGELLTHVKGSDSEPLVSGSQIPWSLVMEYSRDDQSDLDYVHFLDANFDGYVDVYLGVNAPRSNNTLLVWSSNNKQFEIVDGCYLENITLFPKEKKVASFGSCGMAGACVSGSLFRINGNRIIDEQSFETNVDIGDSDMTYTYTIYKGNNYSDVLIECHKKSQLPKEWKDKLRILLDYMWDDIP